MNSQPARGISVHLLEASSIRQGAEAVRRKRLRDTYVPHFYGTSGETGHCILGATLLPVVASHHVIEIDYADTPNSTRV